MCRVTPAKSVKERLEALRHIGPVDRADPDNSISLPECLIDLSKIITHYAIARFVTGTPAIPAGTAMFQFHSLQMDFFYLGTGIIETFHKPFFCSSSQAVQIGA